MLLKICMAENNAATQLTKIFRILRFLIGSIMFVRLCFLVCAFIKRVSTPSHKPFLCEVVCAFVRCFFVRLCVCGGVCVIGVGLCPTPLLGKWLENGCWMMNDD